MKPIFDPSELELSTPGERLIFEKYEKEVYLFMNNKLDGIKLRQETTACAVLAKKIQSRSAMAAIKYDMEKRAVFQPQIESKKKK